MMRFRGSNENICKMMTSHFRTLYSRYIKQLKEVLYVVFIFSKGDVIYIKPLLQNRRQQRPPANKQTKPSDSSSDEKKSREKSGSHENSAGVPRSVTN